MLKLYTKLGEQLPEVLTFAGGENHVTVEPGFVKGEDVLVDARIGSNEDFMQLLCLLDAVRGCEPTSLSLFLPYFPGGRQDRRVPGWAFTARVYANALASAAFLNRVIVVDPHSDVTAALLEAGHLKMQVITIPDILHRVKAGINFPMFHHVICPDAGAEKRAFATAAALNLLAGHRVDVIYARKHRDAMTGELSGFMIDKLPDHRRYLVVDDLCDGGGTFAGLAGAIQADEIGPDVAVDLWVTHGLFSKGLGPLSGFRRVYTTDSHPRAQLVDGLAYVIPLYDVLGEHIWRTL